MPNAIMLLIVAAIGANSVGLGAMLALLLVSWQQGHAQRRQRRENGLRGLSGPFLQYAGRPCEDPCMGSVTRLLYKAARVSNDVEVIASGDPHRMGRRVVNIAKGRILARVGFWRWLWR